MLSQRKPTGAIAIANRPAAAQVFAPRAPIASAMAIPRARGTRPTQRRRPTAALGDPPQDPSARRDHHHPLPHSPSSTASSTIRVSTAGRAQTVSLEIRARALLSEHSNVTRDQRCSPPPTGRSQHRPPPGVENRKHMWGSSAILVTGRPREDRRRPAQPSLTAALGPLALASFETAPVGIIASKGSRWRADLRAPRERPWRASRLTSAAEWHPSATRNTLRNVVSSGHVRA